MAWLAARPADATLYKFNEPPSMKRAISPSMPLAELEWTGRRHLHGIKLRREKGDVAPGTGGTYASFANPLIGNGYMAYYVHIAGVPIAQIGAVMHGLPNSPAVAIQSGTPATDATGGAARREYHVQGRSMALT